MSNFLNFCIYQGSYRTFPGTAVVTEKQAIKSMCYLQDNIREEDILDFLFILTQGFFFFSLLVEREEGREEGGQETSV